MKRLWCWLFGHKHVRHIELCYTPILIVCHDCGKTWPFDNATFLSIKLTGRES